MACSAYSANLCSPLAVHHFRDLTKMGGNWDF